MKFYVYDLETFLNCFLFIGTPFDGEGMDVFELSPRRNMRTELLQFLNYHQNCGTYFIGFNSLNFDYPIIHELMNNPHTFDHHAGYQAGQRIITSGDDYAHQIRLSDRLIPQVDLVKINHFDNKMRRTRLKDLEFAMRSSTVADLPFDPHHPLEPTQMDELIRYGCHDVRETKKFAQICMPQIMMRQELLESGNLTGDVLNYSDVKIGVEYLVKKIGRHKCFSGGRPKQTFRDAIPFKDIILPKINFRQEEFQAVLDWFKSTTYYVKGDTQPSLTAKLAGLDFDFGVGGVHASAESKIFRSDADFVIKDIDVAGMYPAVAVVNGFAPEHLGRDFSIHYKQLGIDRKQYPKDHSMNKMLKLSNNGVYGKSSDVYSCFYDPKYTFSVTVNGQLQLLQLAERLSLIPGLELIQANTDGITCRLPRSLEYLFHMWTKDWEIETGLTLEEVNYSKMIIRDVNNYIAVSDNGKIKRKGAYWYPEKLADYEGVWNKDFSAMIVQKAASLYLVDGILPERTLLMSADPFDFMLRYKAPGGAKLFIGDKETSRTVRYYVSTAGAKMKKVAPPKGIIGDFKRKNGITDAFYRKVKSEVGSNWDERIHTKNKTIYEIVETSIESGRLVRECNVASEFNWEDVDFDYYQKEIEKLIAVGGGNGN